MLSFPGTAEYTTVQEIDYTKQLKIKEINKQALINTIMNFEINTCVEFYQNLKD